MHQALRVDIAVVVCEVFSRLQLRPQLLDLLHVALHDVVHAHAPIASVGTRGVARARGHRVVGLLDFLEVAALYSCNVVCLLVIGTDVTAASVQHHVLRRTVIQHAQVIEELVPVVISAMTGDDLSLRLIW